MKNSKTAIVFTLFFLLSLNVSAQNKFEGYNIIVDAPDTQTVAACAIRYVPPSTDVTITDLDRLTPMKISGCNNSNVKQTGAATATIRADATTFKWCFQGEDKKYRISFKGDQFAEQITYDWIATPDAKNLGFYNVRDFGAAGDGATDDTRALKSAFAFVAAHNGGNVRFPEGDYLISAPVTLPSGVVVEGANGLHTGAATNNVAQKSASRITLSGANRALFRIGECTEKVVVKDIELYAQTNQNTTGIEAVGAFTSSQDFYFERVAFNNFRRGIDAHGLAVTNLGWQFDYVKVNHCRFIYNTDAGIYVNARNSDWKIEGSLFVTPARSATQRADAMRFDHAGMVFIQDTFGGGFGGARGGTFLDILDNGNTTVIGSQSESMTNSIVYNQVENPYAGDYSYPITIVNSIFGDPIEFKARRTFVSTGNLYGAQTFKADERLRVYSTGDRFCYDGGTLACGNGVAPKNFDRATIVFMTAQPDERNVAGRPTVFGTDVQFGAMVQLPSILQNALPTGKPNGSLIYCADCKRSTTPCQAGGTGAPAMVVNGQWSCL